MGKLWALWANCGQTVGKLWAERNYGQAVEKMWAITWLWASYVQAMDLLWTKKKKTLWANYDFNKSLIKAISYVILQPC